jgi:hypothetical protein
MVRVKKKMKKTGFFHTLFLGLESVLSIGGMEKALCGSSMNMEILFMNIKQ